MGPPLGLPGSVPRPSPIPDPLARRPGGRSGEPPPGAPYAATSSALTGG